MGSRIIGDDHLPLIIAEVGINHEGELSKALQLVDAAVAAGAECVKFQCHITGSEMIRTDMKPGDISDEALYRAQMDSAIDLPGYADTYEDSRPPLELAEVAIEQLRLHYTRRTEGPWRQGKSR